MARLTFNRVRIGNEDIPREYFFEGSGSVEYYPIDQTFITLDHCLHRVRTDMLVKAECVLFGNFMRLYSHATETDNDNFGTRIILYYDNVVIFDFFGILKCDYDGKKRQTEVKIEGTIYAE